MKMKPTPPDPRSPEELWNDQHQLLENNPLAWFLKAESLMAAFEVLIADDERRGTTNERRRLQRVASLLGPTTSSARTGLRSVHWHHASPRICGRSVEVRQTSGMGPPPSSATSVRWTRAGCHAQRVYPGSLPLRSAPIPRNWLSVQKFPFLEGTPSCSLAHAPDDA